MPAWNDLNIMDITAIWVSDNESTIIVGTTMDGIKRIDLDTGIGILKQLKGTINLAIGNHDTTNRIHEFNNLSNFNSIQFGYRLTHGKKSFILTHYPTLTGNFDNSKTYSIHGHTHSPNVFCEYDMMYNICCDAHDCRPIALEDVFKEINEHRDKNK